MAIIDNRVTEEGDVLIIKTETPILGLIALTQFVDTTANESQTDYFKKEFRVSENGGLTFGDWIELTLLNIQSVVVDKYDAFVIEYRYTRIGNAPLVELEFHDILVSGTVESLPYPVFDKSYFSKFFNVNDINVFGWALNVLEKIYVKGLILPNFYERGSNQSGLEDEDFIAYWNSITHFFALIVYFARQFHDFDSNEILLLEFLRSKGILLPIDENMTDLLYIFQNYVTEFHKRGTLQIVDQKENGAGVDGELIRLIDHKITEELLFALFENFNTGWCLGKSSPTWTGTEKIVNLIKGYEYSEVVEDLSKYPLYNPSYISIVDEKLSISNTQPLDEDCGIGEVAPFTDDYKITVDPDEAYEISFFVEMSAIESCLLFGVNCFDVSGNQVTPNKSTDNSPSNLFLENVSLNLANQEYWVRGILWNKNKSNGLNDTTTLGVGNNLIMHPLTNSIIPFVIHNPTAVAKTVTISKFRVRPVKFNFSRGQLGVKNIIYLLTKNNNGSYVESELKSIVENKLIPYNSFLKPNFIITEEIPD